MDTIKLGDSIKDSVTGFEGVCGGKVEYLYGDTEYLIVPKAINNEWKDGKWVVSGRVEKTANS